VPLLSEGSRPNIQKDQNAIAVF